MRIHGMERCSLSNGPGRRAVIWFQGCTLGCPGCFNPETHDPSGGRLISTGEARDWIDSVRGGVDGVTFSGGEPFQQPSALLKLAVHSQCVGLSVLIFSGFERGAIEKMPLGRRILEHTDVLVAGPYRHGIPAVAPLLASGNQRLHLLTARYTTADCHGVLTGEVILHANGSVTVSGIAPVRLKDVL